MFDNDGACIPTIDPRGGERHLERGKPWHDVVASRALEGNAAPGQDLIALIESREFLRECICRSMQSAFSLPISAYSTSSELECRGRNASVVILSLMSGNNEEGVNTCKSLSERLPNARIIVLASRNDADLARTVLNCGAKAYIPSTMGFEIAVSVTQFVLAGGTYVPPEIVLETGSSGPTSCPTPGVAPTRETPPQSAAMTRRELAVIQAIQQGKSNKVIAYHLNMCESTVKVHVRNIMKKLAAKNRTEIAMKSRSILNTINSIVAEAA